MNRPTPETKAAAIADLKASGDPYHLVAARHGVSRSTLHDWVKPRPRATRAPKRWGADELEYRGGWEVRGGVRYPLAPERRSA